VVASENEHLDVVEYLE